MPNRWSNLPNRVTSPASRGGPLMFHSRAQRPYFTTGFQRNWAPVTSRPTLRGRPPSLRRLLEHARLRCAHSLIVTLHQLYQASSRPLCTAGVESLDENGSTSFRNPIRVHSCPFAFVFSNPNDPRLHTTPTIPQAAPDRARDLRGGRGSFLRETGARCPWCGWRAVPAFVHRISRRP